MLIFNGTKMEESSKVLISGINGFTGIHLSKYLKSFGYKVYGIDCNILDNTKVKEIKWTPSKDGGLRPVVVFDEVYLAGVKITKATAYNAKYVKDNSIGPGAIIEIIRSGDVIPKIIKVVSPGHVEWPNSSYYWDSNNTHILLENKDSNREVKIRQMEYFITTMGIPFFKKGLLTKAYDKGCNDIFSIISLTYEKLLDYKIDGDSEGEDNFYLLREILKLK